MSDTTTQATIDFTQPNVTIIPNYYVVSCEGMYEAGSTSGDIPTWLYELIGALLKDGIKDFDTLLSNLRTLLLALQDGVHQEIINRETEDGKIVAKIDWVKASFNQNVAAIYDELVTRVTSEEAEAIATRVLGSLFDNGTASSWFISQIKTYATAWQATTESVEALVSTINDPDTGLGALASATHSLMTYVGLTDGDPNGSGLIQDVNILKKQNDGIVETITGQEDIVDANGALLTTASPYADWKAEDDTNGNTDMRFTHTGDTYIKYSLRDDGETKIYEGSWRFAHTIPNPPYTDEDGFGWVEIIDNPSVEAMKAALQAKDLADGKRRVFVDTPKPPYDRGDLWVKENDTLNSTQVYYALRSRSEAESFVLADWTLAATDDTTVNNIIEGKTQIDLSAHLVGDKTLNEYLAGELDKQVVVWSGDPDEKDRVTLYEDPKDGDIFIEYATTTSSMGVTIDVINTYKWENGDWQKINNNDNLLALADLADGKRTIFGDVSIPPDAEKNDLWIPPVDVGNYKKGELYIFNGTTWVKAVKYTDDTTVNAVISGSIQIDLSKHMINGQTLEDYLSREIDNRVVVYSGSPEYKAQLANENLVKKNDLFIEYTTITSRTGVILDVINTYRFNEVDWIQINSNDNLIALADTVDGKRTIFSDPEIPTTAEEGDIWIPPGDVGEYKKGEIYQYISGQWVKTVKYTDDSSLHEFIETTYTQDITSIKDQIDRRIEYWIMENIDEYNANPPQSAWTTPEEKKKHHGDILYFLDSKRAYRYNSAIERWERVELAKDVLELIKRAQETADKKVTTYYQETEPADAEEGDIWFDSNDHNKMYRYENGNWVDVSDGRYISVAQDVSQLQAIVDGDGTPQNPGLTVTIDSIARVVAGKMRTYTYRPSNPNIGDVHMELTGTDGSGHNIYKYEIYLGPSLGWQDFDLQHDIQKATLWAAGASKLITNPDGSITGWEFADSTKTSSTFKINADTFYISDSTNTYKPFTIDAVNRKLKFNGEVNFTNTSKSDVIQKINEGVDNYNSTTINGGVIKTGSIDAQKIKAKTIWTNGSIKSSDFNYVGGNGFRLKADAAGSYSDPTIYGAYIRGGVIDGATLKGQVLDINDAYLKNEAGLLCKMKTVVTATSSPYTVNNFKSGFNFNLGVYTYKGGNNNVKNIRLSKNAIIEGFQPIYVYTGTTGTSGTNKSSISRLKIIFEIWLYRNSNWYLTQSTYQIADAYSVWNLSGSYTSIINEMTKHIKENATANLNIGGLGISYQRFRYPTGTSHIEGLAIGFTTSYYQFSYSDYYGGFIGGKVYFEDIDNDQYNQILRLDYNTAYSTYSKQIIVTNI